MIAEALHAVLLQRPLGLVFDIDGTLSPMAPTPGEARLYPGVAELLQQEQQYAHVGIVTGRAILDGARLVNVEGLTYVGTHGLEWSAGLPTTHPVELLPEARPYIEPGKHLLDLAERELVPAIPSLLVQRKLVGGSLHYRLAADPEQARELILATLKEPAAQANMLIDEGKRVIEVLAPLTTNKGTAMRRFVNQFGLRAIIFAGDDRTDLNGLLELEKLRQEGYATLGIAVQHHDTPPAILEHADIVVQEVAGMVQLMQEINAFLASAKVANDPRT
ncbi:MAG: trehalose-phosphatase [Ktedonobacteraceae bacterium]